jgi:phosphatidylserine/phosphatidylglycerophosphate/cardiolipin synthase-like enzyme
VALGVTMTLVGGLAVTRWAGADGTALAAPTAATISGYPVWAHFTNPRVNAGRDHTIHNELRRLIDAAPAGSTIRVAMHSLSIDPVATALVDAQTRGVTVWALLDGKNLDSTDPSIGIIRQLTNHRFCTYGAGRACVSTSADGDMHTKMATFTATTDPNGVARGDVAWFGSANNTYATGTDAFNNTITVYGDAALMNGLNANFGDMWNRRHYAGNDYYNADVGRGYYLAGAADVYASPERAGQTDTIVNRLNDITPDTNCRVRIAMANVTTGRPGLVGAVTRLRTQGCKVWMVVGGDSSGIDMSESVFRELDGAGVAIRRMQNLHDKYFAVYGKFDGTYRYRVYTGSQNWTQDALSENDEIFVKMGWETGATHPLYDAFFNHFRDAYDPGALCQTYPCR